MRAALWAWLCRLAVRIYPGGVRERYGREVEDLLSRNASAKDLSDVVWCAALERAGGVTLAGVRRGVLRAVVLAALVPGAVTAWMLLILAAAKVLPGTLMSDDLFDVWLFLVQTVLPAMVLVPLAFLFGRKLARRWPMPPAVVAGCLAAGALGLAAVPGAGTLLGELWAPAAVAIGVWLAGMLVLVPISGALTARVPGVVAVPASMVMAYTVLSAATAAFAATLATIEVSAWVWSPMWRWSPLWYPVALTGGESSYFLQVWPAYATASFLPQVLTLLSVFVLAWRTRSRSDVLTAPKDLVAA